MAAYVSTLFALIDSAKVTTCNNKQVTALGAINYGGLPAREIYYSTNSATEMDPFILCNDQSVNVGNNNQATVQDVYGASHSMSFLSV